MALSIYLTHLAKNAYKFKITVSIHQNFFLLILDFSRYFWFHSEVKFLTRFDVVLDLVNVRYFNAISVYFYVLKGLIYIFFE